MLIQGNFGALEGMQSGMNAAVSQLQSEMGKLQQQAAAWLEANPDMAGNASHQVSQEIHQLNQALDHLQQMTGTGVGRTHSEFTSALASARARFV